MRVKLDVPYTDPRQTERDHPLASTTPHGSKDLSKKRLAAVGVFPTAWGRGGVKTLSSV